MSITFLVGHPVPYSLTVQRNGRSISARPHIDAVRSHLNAAYEREAIITKTDGAYVFYDFLPDGFRRPRFSVAAIDVGFDVRAHNMPVEYCIDGPVLLEYSRRRIGQPSEKISRLCDTKAEALRILRRHGYRVIASEAKEVAE